VAQRRAHLARDIIEVLVLIGIVFVITKFAIQAYAVPDDVMQPSLAHTQSVLVNRLAYAFGAPAYGDVIVFADPSDASGHLLARRIIALPGDTIALTATNVQVNGVTLSEPYISVPYGQPQNRTIQPGLKLDSNSYYVMCDSRLGDATTPCADSRTFGPVPRGNIIGKAVLVYWPVTAFHLLPNYSDAFSQAAKQRH
jgi:signal peptidase I